MSNARTVTINGTTKGSAFREDNKLRPEDRTAHDWYRFVLWRGRCVFSDFVNAEGNVVLVLLPGRQGWRAQSILGNMQG